MFNADQPVFVAGCRGQLGLDVLDVFPPVFRVTGADLPELDITSPPSVIDVLGASGAGAVVNCAAYTQVDRAETERELARRVNVEGPLLLAKFAEAHKAWLVHVSTDYVFDGLRPPPEPYLESDRPRPNSHYGLTKLEGEMAVRHTATRHLIVRTAWLYGFRGQNFLKTMLRLALSGPDRVIRVVNDQHGCPTWSHRLALQLREMLSREASPGIYHATGSGHCTWYAFARAFLERMDVPHQIEPCTTADYPTPARRPANSILDNRKLRDAGLHLMRPWEEDLDAFVAQHREALLTEARARLATN